MNIDPKHVETILDVLDDAVRTIEIRLVNRPRMSPALKAALKAESEKLRCAYFALKAATEN